MTPPSFLAYDAPLVINFMPNTPDAGVGQAIEVIGHNFGPIASTAVVTIGGVPCSKDEAPGLAEWIGDDRLRCITLRGQHF
jgi:hypothetical protein